MIIDAAESLARLKEGNARYASGNADRPHSDVERRLDLEKGQNPFAVILACADSRVVPELIFDRGLGDLFVIRVAGNIMDKAILGSVEYAVGHLDTKLVMVMGHQSCGAVGAAVAGDPTDNHIDELIEAIGPAVEKARLLDGDLLANAVRINAQMVADDLRVAEPVMGRHVIEDGVEVVAAVYSFETGKVELV